MGSSFSTPRFLPNVSTKVVPLHQLLQKNAPWNRGSGQQQAFEVAKFSLSLSSCLAHYSPESPLVVSCDASSYGVGAMLAHKLFDCVLQPIAFASCTLLTAERRYAQVDQEGLAIVSAVLKFRQYLLGRFL